MSTTARDQNKPRRIEYIEGLTEVVIVDLDGTIAINDGHRGFYDEEKVYDDLVYENLRVTLTLISKGDNKISFIFVSGRSDSCYDETMRFLKEKVFIDGQLLMRKTGDQRPDYVVKKEIYETHIKGKYNILAVFDDRLTVCRMWYNEGLPIFRVGDPDLDV